MLWGDSMDQQAKNKMKAFDGADQCSKFSTSGRFSIGAGGIGAAHKFIIS
jgi:hypothetical protein